MSVDKLVDSTQLDADLTSVANAIRTKGGTSAPLAFPADFVQSIGDIPAGDTVYMSSKGIQYTENVVYPSSITNFLANEMYRYCTNMKSISAPGIVSTDKAPFGAAGGGNSGHPGITTVDFPNLEIISYRLFTGLSKCKYFNLPKIRQITTNNFTFRYVTEATVILGSIGHPVEKLVANALGGGSLSDVTVYVDAESISEITTNVTSTAPWGAGSGATITYRSSTTGEVLT